jgi:hypothetical protein
MAANHFRGVGLSVVAILVISAAPMYAQAHEPGADTFKAETRNVAKIISGNKRKSQTYCKSNSMTRSTKRKTPQKLES